MTAQKGTARGRNVPMLNVGDATFVFQGVKTVVDALYQKKWKRVPVEMSCALNVG